MLQIKQAILNIPIGDITPSDGQPRQNFEREALISLARSIAAHGVLQPLIVRPEADGGYRLVAGERRLRAAVLAHLSAVPCILYDKSNEECAVATMVENLQRRDLSCWEEADGYKALIEQFGMTQTRLAETVGKSQASIANKLRLLRLPKEVRVLFSERGMTERHARALLALPPDRAIAAAREIVSRGLNVTQTERYVERLCGAPSAPPRPAILRDTRICRNTLKKAVRLMQKTGLAAEMTETSGDGFVEYRIRVPIKP